MHFQRFLKYMESRRFNRARKLLANAGKLLAMFHHDTLNVQTSLAAPTLRVDGSMVMLRVGKGHDIMVSPEDAHGLLLQLTRASYLADQHEAERLAQRRPGFNPAPRPDHVPHTPANGRGR